MVGKRLVSPLWLQSPAVMLYVASFIMPAVVAGGDWYFGAIVFILGAVNIWVNVFIAPDFPQGFLLSLCWAGNLTLFGAFYWARRNGFYGAILAACFSLLLMLLFLSVDVDRFVDSGGRPSEAHRVNWSSLHIGYYLWVLSPLVLMLEAFVKPRRK